MNCIAGAAVWCLLIGSGVAVVQGPPSNANDATKAVGDALAEAKKAGKHVLLNFGAGWCLECRVLDKTFADPTVAGFLHANFVVVPVHVGQMVGVNYAEQNVDLVRKYEVFTTKENTGIPYIVILDPGGSVIGRTDSGEWRHESAVAPESVIRDLKRWAPKR
jgi:protein disulfide-isomerase